MESRAGFLRLKEEQKLEREMDGYMNWICRAGESKMVPISSSSIPIVCLKQKQPLFSPGLIEKVSL